MKKLIAFVAGLALTTCVTAQLKVTKSCPAFYVDILDGKVNDLYPSSSNAEVKGKFPCFTSTQDENSSSTCGGSVFYKDKDIYFHTGRDYVEIREKFKGKLSIPLMGAARTSLFKWLGLPKLKETNWEAFQTAYGTLVLYFNKSGRVNKIQFSTKSSETLQLCE
jgi:hypothetical protein